MKLTQLGLGAFWAQNDFGGVITCILRLQFLFIAGCLLLPRPDATLAALFHRRNITVPIRKIRAGLWHKHCGQMPGAYDVEGATKDGRKIF